MGEIHCQDMNDLETELTIKLNSLEVFLDFRGIGTGSRKLVLNCQACCVYLGMALTALH